MKFTMTAAVLAIAAATIAIPAQAEYYYGPTQQNGQCWTGDRDGRGHWEACAKPASVVATAAPAAKHAKHPAASR